MWDKVILTAAIVELTSTSNIPSAHSSLCVNLTMHLAENVEQLARKIMETLAALHMYCTI